MLTKFNEKLEALYKDLKDEQELNEHEWNKFGDVKVFVGDQDSEEDLSYCYFSVKYAGTKVIHHGNGKFHLEILRDENAEKLTPSKWLAKVTKILNDA